MADVESKAKISLEAQDNTGQAFGQLGNKIKELEKRAKTLSFGLKDLATGIIGAFTITAALNFMNQAGEAALEDAAATRELTSQVESLGIAYESVSPRIESFIDSMRDLGREDTETTKAIREMLVRTGDINDAMALTKLASDLAASGVGTYTGNMDLLGKVLIGKGVRALTEYGIAISKDATITEQLTAIQKRATISTEEWANTTEGELARMDANWKKFQESGGKITTWIKGSFAESFLNVGRMIGDFFGKKTTEEVKTGLEEIEKAGNNAQNKIEELGDEAEKYAEKIGNAFKDISKSVVSAVEDQEKAIYDLRAEMKKLDESLDASLKKSNDKYRKDVIGLARNAQERIAEIDKEIEDENTKQSQGFRTRIEELEKEKAKEQAIIAKAGGQVSDINSEIAKDEFDTLAEKHEKELKEMKDQAEKKRLELQAEELERKKFLLETQVKVGQPGFFEKATKEGMSFLGEIGAGATQQFLTFNFNEVVAGDEGIEKIKKMIIDALDRTATLNTAAGK